MYGWPAGTVVRRRRRIAEHLRGKHNQQDHGRRTHGGIDPFGERSGPAGVLADRIGDMPAVKAAHSWPETKPWERSGADIEAGKVPGVHARALGSQMEGGEVLGFARIDDGTILIDTAKWDALPPKARANLLYHELGHLSMSSAIADERIRNRLAALDPYGNPNKSERIADLYARVATTKPSGDTLGGAAYTSRADLRVHVAITKEARHVGAPAGTQVIVFGKGSTFAEFDPRQPRDREGQWVALGRLTPAFMDADHLYRGMDPQYLGDVAVHGLDPAKSKVSGGQGTYFETSDMPNWSVRKGVAAVRVKSSVVSDRTERAGGAIVIARKVIPPKDIEFFGGDKKWHPVSDIAAPLAEHDGPGAHSTGTPQEAHGGPRALALATFEIAVAREEHARNPNPGYGGSFGPERALVVDADGNEIWSGTGGRVHVDPPKGSMKPGVTITHFHPQTTPGPAELSQGDIEMSLKTGATVRAFNHDGTWQEFVPNRPGQSLGMNDMDLYAYAATKASEHGGSITAAYKAELRSSAAAMGTFNEGKHSLAETVAEADPESGTAKSAAMKASWKVEHALWDMTTDELLDLRSQLEAARKATVDQLSRATKEWKVADRKAVLASLDKALAEVEQRMTAQLTSIQRQAWEKGVDMPRTTARAMGSTVSTMPYVSPDLLAVMAGTLPELITNVTAGIKKDVNFLMRQAALGQMSPLDVMKQMGTVAGKGPWSSAFLRGEIIYRTEMGRALAQGTQASMNALEQQYPGEWMKEWHAQIDRRTRPSHILANGQRVAVNKAFSVGDALMMYPHDPRGPARETINCRCFSMPVRPEWDKVNEPVSAADEKRAYLNDEVTKFKRAVDDAQADYQTKFDKAREKARRDHPDRPGWQQDQFAAAELEAARKARDVIIKDAGEAAARAIRQLTAKGLSTAEVGALVDDFLRVSRSLSRVGYGWKLQGAIGEVVQAFRLTMPLADRLAVKPSYSGRGSVWLRKAWDITKDSALTIERLGYGTTNWFGSLDLGTSSRNAAGTYSQGYMHLSTKTAKYNEFDSHGVIIHELGHGVSEAAGGHDVYSQMRGWEEGVVEGWKQEIMADVRRAMNLPETPAYRTYHKYTKWLDLIAADVGMSRKDFYVALIKVPLADRPSWVLDRITDPVLYRNASADLNS